MNTGVASLVWEEGARRPEAPAAATPRGRFRERTARGTHELAAWHRHVARLVEPSVGLLRRGDDLHPGRGGS
ncbi:hypothetical protein STENM327S_04509 [Streptomyces tendae]